MNKTNDSDSVEIRREGESLFKKNQGERTSAGRILGSNSLTPYNLNRFFASQTPVDPISPPQPRTPYKTIEGLDLERLFKESAPFGESDLLTLGWMILIQLQHRIKILPPHNGFEASALVISRGGRIEFRSTFASDAHQESLGADIFMVSDLDSIGALLSNCCGYNDGSTDINVMNKGGDGQGFEKIVAIINSLRGIGDSPFRTYIEAQREIRTMQEGCEVDQLKSRLALIRRIDPLCIAYDDILTLDENKRGIEK